MNPQLSQLLLCFTLLGHVLSAGFYGADTHIYELTPANFDKVVHQSNYTTIVEFYAPWCGYCKQLEPIFRKLGKYIHGNARYAVHVAAVDCDRDVNKPLCQKHRVQGFPTLKIFRPPKFSRGSPSSKGKHVPETYNGQRELIPMVEYLSTRMKNYVKKFHGVSESLGEWLWVQDKTKKAIIVSNSKTISALARSLAIDFLESLSLASVSLKEKSSFVYDGHTYELPVSKDDKLPVLLAFDDSSKSFVRYEGNMANMKKIQKFLMKTLDIVPSEGHLSKREKVLRKYRGVSAKDEL